jgi:hypothetical protein
MFGGAWQHGRLKDDVRAKYLATRRDLLGGQ